MAKNSIPTDFDSGNDADANMDGRTPITAGPEVPAQLATDPNFNAHVEREVERGCGLRKAITPPPLRSRQLLASVSPQWRRLPP